MNEASDLEIVQLLTAVRSKGVRLWSADGQLHYKAPKGVLNAEEIGTLRAVAGRIIGLLEQAHCGDAQTAHLGLAQRLNCTPLTFSQLARWHTYQMGERRPMRQVAAKAHIRGRLHVPELRRSLAHVVSRHEALRTCIVMLDGTPVQYVAATHDCSLIHSDLSRLDARAREHEVEQLIDRVILQPIDFARGGLVAVHLVKLADDDHVLLVAMEHMISDGSSLNLLVRELLTAYAQALRGSSFLLPVIAHQFPDYALRQRADDGSWQKKHGNYWDSRLTGYRRQRFPDRPHAPQSVDAGWGVAHLRMDAALRLQLLQWCRKHQTTLAIATFTAYAALVLRWCAAHQCVIQFESDGRDNDPAIAHTIGFFASALYLHVALDDADSFATLLRRVMQAYCEACEHADHSRFEAAVPRPAFTRNTTFNWVPHGSTIEIPELDGSADALVCSSTPLAQRMLHNLWLDQEPGLLLFDQGSEVVGGVHFPHSRFCATQMQRFAGNFLEFVGALLRDPERRVAEIPLI